MITAKRIREHLATRPFKPFRIFLTDGSKHDVPHPEFAWVFGSIVYVGRPGRHPLGLDDDVSKLAILHVSRLEPIPPAKAKK